MAGQLWKVIGGADKGGLLVRSGPGLDSPIEAERLAAGSIVRQLEILGNRLCFERVTGEGPLIGWVSCRLNHKELLIRFDAAEPEAKVTGEDASGSLRGCAAGAASAAAPGAAPSQPGASRTRSPGPLRGHAADTTSIAFFGLNGEEVASLSVPSSTTLWQIKEKLADVCGAPPRQQRLLPFHLSGRKCVLDNNDTVASLGGTPLQMQLVKLAERDDWFKLHVRGMWSLSGTECMFAAASTASLKKVRRLIHRATGLPPELQELDVDGGGTWDDDDARLCDVLGRAPRSEMDVTVYLFARARPERAKLLADLSAGLITHAQLAALDPDALMPAC